MGTKAEKDGIDLTYFREISNNSISHIVNFLASEETFDIDEL